jgi:nucleotide-binding universal stress UspA family protein
MALKDILVHLDGAAPSAQRLALAAELARRHQAHLTGLFVVDLTPPVLGAMEGGGGAVLAGLIEQMRAEALATAAGVEARFAETLARERIAGEWRIAEGAAPELVGLHARYADLVVLGQADPQADEAAGAAVVAAALFGSGRPVLVVPHSGVFPGIGRRVLVGWNASREATRAVHDALPLLMAADSVTIAAVNPRRGLGAHGDEPGADIARHLARHGARVQVEHSTAPEIGAGDILLNRAADLSADLLVVGAYGHSRLREMFLGGVTRTLLGQMTLPVLLSH